MIDKRQYVGKKGEDAACDYLLKRGHDILFRNWRASHREIDIISIKNGVLHIVEVKSKTAPIIVEPIFNVNKNKQKNLEMAAKSFLNSKARYKLPQDLEVVFDVISVIFENDGMHIEYYPQAYIPTYV